MATPSDKSEGAEDFMKKIFGFNRREYIKRNECVPAPVGCGGPAIVFEDDLSRREFTISGLCQQCQNSIFKGDDA